MKTFLLSLFLATTTALAATAPVQAADGQAAGTPAAPQLQAALRNLWQGHIEHTRAYAVAVKAADAKAAEQAAADVVSNAKAIAAAVASFYGEPAGKQMLTLLAGHWGAVKALTDARKANDEAAYTTAADNLGTNAGEIAKFLAGANPYLPEQALLSLLTGHGAHHMAQIDQLMRGDASGEAATQKAMQAHMDTIADALAGALAKQFPAKAK